MALVKYNNNSISAVTSASSIPSGALTHIKTLTASSSGTLSFVHGTSSVVLDSTYPIYIFKFINMHPANNAAQPTFQVDTGTNTNYNTTIAAATHFVASQNEGDSGGGVGYYNENTGDITSFLRIGVSTGNDNDQNLNATLQLFNPASSTFNKQFILRSSSNTADDHEHDFFLGGIFNTTTAITRVRFKFSAGNIDAGIFKLYGIT